LPVIDGIGIYKTALTPTNCTYTYIIALLLCSFLFLYCNIYLLYMLYYKLLQLLDSFI